MALKIQHVRMEKLRAKKFEFLHVRESSLDGSMALVRFAHRPRASTASESQYLKRRRNRHSRPRTYIVLVHLLIFLIYIIITIITIDNISPQ